MKQFINYIDFNAIFSDAKNQTNLAEVAVVNAVASGDPQSAIRAIMELQSVHQSHIQTLNGLALAAQAHVAPTTHGSHWTYSPFPHSPIVGRRDVYDSRERGGRWEGFRREIDQSNIFLQKQMAYPFFAIPFLGGEFRGMFAGILNNGDLNVIIERLMVDEEFRANLTVALDDLFRRYFPEGNEVIRVGVATVFEVVAGRGLDQTVQQKIMAANAEVAELYQKLIAVEEARVTRRAEEPPASHYPFQRFQASAGCLMSYISIACAERGTTVESVKYGVLEWLRWVAQCAAMTRQDSNG